MALTRDRVSSAERLDSCRVGYAIIQTISLNYSRPSLMEEAQGTWCMIHLMMNPFYHDG